MKAVTNTMKLRESQWKQPTLIISSTHMYIYVFVCVCVCVFSMVSSLVFVYLFYFYFLFFFHFAHLNEENAEHNTHSHVCMLSIFIFHSPIMWHSWESKKHWPQNAPYNCVRQDQLYIWCYTPRILNLSHYFNFLYFIFLFWNKY